MRFKYDYRLAGEPGWRQHRVRLEEAMLCMTRMTRTVTLLACWRRTLEKCSSQKRESQPRRGLLALAFFLGHEHNLQPLHGLLRRTAATNKHFVSAIKCSTVETKDVSRFGSTFTDHQQMDGCPFCSSQHADSLHIALCCCLFCFFLAHRAERSTQPLHSPWLTIGQDHGHNLPGARKRFRAVIPFPIEH